MAEGVTSWHFRQNLEDRAVSRSHLDGKIAPCESAGWSEPPTA